MDNRDFTELFTVNIEREIKQEKQVVIFGYETFVWTTLGVKRYLNLYNTQRI